MVLSPHLRILPLLVLCLVGIGFVGCKSDEDKLAEFMRRGEEYKEAEQWPEAIIEFRNGLQIDPNHAPAHEALAEAYMHNEMIKEAYWELSETVRLDPSNADARLSYGTVSLAAGQFEESLSQADAIIELDSENAPAYVLRGQALAQLDRLDEAEAPLVRATEIDPENSAYPLLLAAYYQMAGRELETEQQLKRSLEIERTVRALGALGRLYANQGDRDDEAVALFREAIALSSERDEEGNQSPDLTDAYQTLARLYFQRERSDEAVSTLEEGIEKTDEPFDLIYLLAQYLRSTGDEDGADALMLRAAEKAGEDPTPLLTLSNLRQSRGDMAGALEAAELAVEAAPDSEDARLRKAELLIDVGIREQDPARSEEGNRIVDAVLAEDPTSANALFVRAKYQLGTGDQDGAIDTLRQAMEIRPGWPEAHFVLGSALALRGDNQRARAELARAVELQPALLEARGLLIKIHVQLGEHEYAVDHGREYLAARPDDNATRVFVAQSMLSLGRSKEAMALLEEIPPEKRDVAALFAIGRVKLASGDTKGAQEVLLQANELRPNNPKVLEALFAIDRSNGTISHSIKRLNDAVAAEPDVAALWSLRGTVEAAVGNLQESEKSLRRAIELEPGHSVSYQRLAQLYGGMGRMNELVTLYEGAVESKPESAASHHFLAILYEMEGRNEEAMAQYELALKFDPSLGEAKNNLAYLMAESGGDLDRALELAQEAKAAMPESANAADTLGWVLYKRGVASAAIGYLREAIQLSEPDSPAVGEIRLHLSFAYEASGDHEKAIEMLETALADFERQKKKNAAAAGEPKWTGQARERLDTLRAAS